MLVEKELLTIGDFWKLFQQRHDSNTRMELIDGQVVRQPIDLLSETLCSQIFAHLDGFIRPRKLGQLSSDLGFYRSRDQHNVRMPDISFISYERTQPLGKQGFIPYMPDLAILIQLPTMSMMEAAERGMFFLKNGSSLVWILHPRTGTADVCTRSPKKSFRVYKVGAGGSLGGSDVLLGFSLELQNLFSIS